MPAGSLNARARVHDDDVVRVMQLAVVILVDHGGATDVDPVAFVVVERQYPLLVTRIEQVEVRIRQRGWDVEVRGAEGLDRDHERGIDHHGQRRRQSIRGHRNDRGLRSRVAHLVNGGIGCEGDLQVLEDRRIEAGEQGVGLGGPRGAKADIGRLRRR